MKTIKFLAALVVITLFSPWARSQTVVADLARDFGAGMDKSNWSFLWNQTGTVGYAANYVRCKPSSIFAQYGDTSYTPDGTADLPSKITKEAGDLYLRADKGAKFVVGDCGFGPVQGARDERFNIMAYKMPTGGDFRIINSELKSLVKMKKGNGIHYKIYVNDHIIKMGSVEAMGTTSFDCSLGILSSGDVVYVAVGPGQFADYTNFSIEYQIASSQ